MLYKALCVRFVEGVSTFDGCLCPCGQLFYLRQAIDGCEHSRGQCIASVLVLSSDSDVVGASFVSRGYVCRRLDLCERVGHKRLAKYVFFVGYFVPE